MTGAAPRGTSPSAAADGPDTATPPGLDGLMRIATGFMASKVLLVAARLGLFTVLSTHGPLDADALGTRLGLHPRSSRDFLDALVALGMLDRTAGVYANSPSAERHLAHGGPDCVAGFLEAADRTAYGLWGRLESALRTGAPQDGAPGGEDGTYAARSQRPDHLASFGQVTPGPPTGSASALAEAVDWSRHRTVAAIGRAAGAALTDLLRRHPHLRGTGFDLPSAGAAFRRRAAAAGLTDRLSFTPGDFRTDPLPRTDVLVLGHTPSGCAPAPAGTLLRKAYEALPDGGMVVVHETPLGDDRRENLPELLMSLTLLLETPGASASAGAACRRRLSEAGFRNVRVRRPAGSASTAVGVK
ncbi:methyltransferase [Streptomyces sp. URMC 126]|uniref:methyltransferase n=1 Tax=Streptomyces sp. URMC 126 TaxID=3423401 RepID=UPI003F1AF0C7